MEQCRPPGPDRPYMANAQSMYGHTTDAHMGSLGMRVPPLFGVGMVQWIPLGHVDWTVGYRLNTVSGCRTDCRTVGTVSLHKSQVLGKKGCTSLEKLRYPKRFQKLNLGPQPGMARERDGSGWLGMARDGLGGSRMLEGGLGWLGMAREARDTWESAGTTETHFPWRGAVSFKVPNAHVRWLYTSH